MAGTMLLLVPCFAYSLALKIEETYFSKMLGSLRTTHHYNTDDFTPHCFFWHLICLFCLPSLLSGTKFEI